MIHLLRKLFPTPDRILAAAAAGSAVLYTASTGRSSIAGSVPTITRESLLLPWKPKQWDQCPFGWFFPQLDTKKDDASGVTIAGERPQRTYATAFAKVGTLDKDGIVLTCAHAFVNLGLGTFGDSYKEKVYITLQDGRSLEGNVVNLDVHSDIAIVKVDSGTPLPSAELGCLSKVQPGECVIAVGSPLSFKHTVTAGIVSCATRKNSKMRQDGWREYKEYIQTDCSINPGNSGGPLVNMDGEVNGVNVRMIRAADGLNFAVPIDSVTKVMDQFKKNGRVVRPWLGVKIIELNDMIISQLEERGSSLPNVKKGILVPMDDEPEVPLNISTRSLHAPSS